MVNADTKHLQSSSSAHLQFCFLHCCIEPLYESQRDLFSLSTRSVILSHRTFQQMASANLASPSGRICSQYTTQCSLRRSVPAASGAPVYCCSSLSSAHSTSSFSPSVRDHAPCQSFSLQSSLPAKHQIIRRYPHGYEDIVCSASASTAGEVRESTRDLQHGRAFTSCNVRLTGGYQHFFAIRWRLD